MSNYCCFELLCNSPPYQNHILEVPFFLKKKKIPAVKIKICVKPFMYQHLNWWKKKTLKILTNNGELLLLSVGVPSLEAELERSKRISFNYFSFLKTSYSKNCNSWEALSIRGLFFLTSYTFCCFLLHSSVLFFPPMMWNPPCKHFGWKITR